MLSVQRAKCNLSASRVSTVVLVAVVHTLSVWAVGRTVLFLVRIVYSALALDLDYYAIDDTICMY